MFWYNTKISVVLWIFHLKETLRMYFSKSVTLNIWDREKKKSMQNITLTISTACYSLYFSGILKYSFVYDCVIIDWLCYNFVYDYGESGRVFWTSFHLASYSLRSAYRTTISVGTGYELSVASILMFLPVDPKEMQFSRLTPSLQRREVYTDHRGSSQEAHSQCSKEGGDGW